MHLNDSPQSSVSTCLLSLWHLFNRDPFLYFCISRQQAGKKSFVVPCEKEVYISILVKRVLITEIIYSKCELNVMFLDTQE